MSRSETASEQNIQEMKRKILDQIDRTIEESPPRTKGNSSVMSTGVSPALPTDYGVSRRWNTNASDVDEDAAINVSKNLRVLKQQILEKERVQDVQNSKLKNRSHVMGDEINNMREKLVVMQDTLKGRDRAIMDLEYQLSDTRSFAVQQSRENILEKTQEDMHNTIMELRNKLLLRKSQMTQLKDDMARQDQQFAEEKRRMMDERITLERSVEALRERYEEERFVGMETKKQLEKARSDLLNRENEQQRYAMEQVDQTVMEMQGRFAREQELYREQRVQNQIQEKKIVELERQLLVMEEKLMKTKKKAEEEKLTLAGDRKKETEKRKQKNRKLKVELRSLEEKANELAGDGAELRSEKDRLNRALNQLQQELALRNAEIAQQKETITGLREDVDVLKHSVRDGDLLLKREQSEFKKLEKEAKSLAEVVQERNERLGEFEGQLEKEREAFAALDLDFQRQVDVNRQQQDLILKIERQNQFLTEMQNRDIDKLEEKVALVNQEAVSIKRENEVLRQETQTLKMELEYCDKRTEQDSERLHKYKNQVALLKHSLAEADEKLRELIYQKHNEIRNGHGHDDDDEEDDRNYHGYYDEEEE